jgi:hypothetical protein
MTSAPRSPSHIPVIGPAQPSASSSTRRPASGRAARDEDGAVAIVVAEAVAEADLDARADIGVEPVAGEAAPLAPDRSSAESSARTSFWCWPRSGAGRLGWNRAPWSRKGFAG